MPAPPEHDGDTGSPYATTETALEESVGLDLAMAGARPGEGAAVVLAQAKIAGALFGPVAGRLGRFRVLERLGVGGMGVVYAAYDPELDRGVALKLVRVPSGGREAALAEAKALARLSHPHVVPVYDVGIEGAHVYIVMELVRGETLGRWVKDRSRRDIVTAYRQAGEALAAAHAAGLVHRDFKPDNAIMGRDGRVRVVDFGLACESSAPDGVSPQRVPIAGTPRYMPPEQAAGSPVTPAVDQFSFCVALAEALAPGGPPPSWLAAVIERGRAATPAARFASMPELLRALGRDPARQWRWRAAIAAVALTGGGAFLVGRATPAADPDVCGGGAAELAKAWSPEQRSETLGRIAQLGPYGQEVSRQLDAVVGDHATRWTAARRDACWAHRQGVQSDDLLDRRMACLERGRAALTAVADIAAAVDAATLPQVALAARALPDPGACADIQLLLAGSDPPPTGRTDEAARLRRAIERIRVQIAAGRTAEARDVATGTIAEARELGYRPILVEALLVHGHASMSMSGRAAAIPALAEATTLALAAGADALAVEAWARRAWVQGTTGDPSAALAGVELIEAVAERATSTPFARALLHNNRGSVELAGGHVDRARGWFERALDEAEGIPPPGGAELLASRINLALVTNDPERRDALLSSTVDEMARLYGASHPRTLEAGTFRGRLTVRLDDSAELLAAACGGLELHPGYERATRKCWADVGFARGELGQDAAAVAALERAARFDSEADGDPTSEVAAYLLLWRGNPAASAARFAEQLARLPALPGAATWSVLNRARLELGLGRAARAAGQLGRARTALEASLADSVAALGHPGGQLLVARARAELALTRAALGEKPAAIAPMAELALAWLRPAHARSDDLVSLERLLSRD